MQEMNGTGGRGDRRTRRSEMRWQNEKEGQQKESQKVEAAEEERGERKEEEEKKT